MFNFNLQNNSPDLGITSCELWDGYVYQTEFMVLDSEIIISFRIIENGDLVRSDMSCYCNMHGHWAFVRKRDNITGECNY